MSVSIPAAILGLKGQRVNKIQLDYERQQIVIHCSRDRRRNAVDPVTGKKGTVNRYVRRLVCVFWRFRSVIPVLSDHLTFPTRRA